MNHEELKASTTTPPLSYQDSRLLTPPPTDENTSSALQPILSEIERYKSGLNTSDRRWLGFKISATQYFELERRLSEDDFCLNKLRCGYFPLLNLFIIRMPTPVHERFLVQVHDDIRSQLRSLATGSSAGFAKDIKIFGSTTYKPIDPDFGRHDPDGSFRHVKERFPGVVIEAAYAQKGKMLRDLAEDYILGSDLKVRVMVGFDISYEKKDAIFSVWQPHLQREIDGEVWSVDSEVKIIRHADGKPNDEPGAGLLLHLRDFASVEFCEKFGDMDGTIFISCKSLCTYLTEAESDMNVESALDGPNPLLRKRRRTRTPEEELGTDDEKSVVEAEERAAKRVDRVDTSNRDSSSTASENG